MRSFFWCSAAAFWIAFFVAAFAWRLSFAASRFSALAATLASLRLSAAASLLHHESVSRALEVRSM